LEAYKLLVTKPKGKRSLGRQRHRWENNIKMDPAERGCEGVDWFNISQDRGYALSHISETSNKELQEG
jgi:hypothetical protein